jgi:hypothetical protein
MNKERRQELGEVIDYLDDAIIRLEEIRDDEQDSFDDLPEGLQNSRTGDSMLNAIDQLDEFCSDIEKVKSKVSDMMSNKKKKK